MAVLARWPETLSANEVRGSPGRHPRIVSWSQFVTTYGYGIDAEDKRAIGAIWASRSDGRCLFVMQTDGDFSTIRKLLDA